MDLGNRDRYKDDIQPTSDLLKAKQEELKSALQSIADLIDVNRGLLKTKAPNSEHPQSTNAASAYNILSDVENILKNDLENEIEQLEKALISRYVEAIQNQDWKQAHDLLLHAGLKRPKSSESNYTTRAKGWITKAKELLD